MDGIERGGGTLGNWAIVGSLTSTDTEIKVPLDPIVDSNVYWVTG